MDGRFDYTSLMGGQLAAWKGKRPSDGRPCVIVAVTSVTEECEPITGRIYIPLDRAVEVAGALQLVAVVALEGSQDGASEIEMGSSEVRGAAEKEETAPGKLYLRSRG